MGRPHKSLLVEKLQRFIKGLNGTISSRRSFFIFSYFFVQNGMKPYILRSLSKPHQIASHVTTHMYMKFNTHSIGRIVNPIVERINYHRGTPDNLNAPNMHKTLSLLIVNGWYPDLPENNYSIRSCPAPNLRGRK